MSSFVGEGFEIEFRWKEEVIYWEGNRGFVFVAGWGSTPSDLPVPTEEAWNGVVPAWLQDRRAAIVDRLRRHSGHRVRADAGDRDRDVTRDVSR